MSALALREATVQRAAKLKDQFVSALVERSQDSLDQIRLNQGIVQGIELCLQQQADAYKAMGE